ncbi:MAG: hypothetical protein KAU21_17380, partial [Gammaproteobacteria bacterium]|nr:hypothetical protein [Gammaproteobacteria bacterium]
MGDEVSTESVKTDADDAVDTSTVLTGDDAAASAATDDKAADVVAAQAILDADNSELSADDKAAAQAIVDAAADAGSGDDAGSPDTYADFVMPEGIQLTEPLITEATALFKEDNLTQEKAQKYIDLAAKQVQAGSEAQINAFNQLTSDWRDQSKSDSEFGGDKFDESVKVAQAAVNKYGTPGLKTLLEEHGVGNHPEVVRFMVRVGKTLKEDVPGSPGAATSQAQSRVDLLYPND